MKVQEKLKGFAPVHCLSPVVKGRAVVAWKCEVLESTQYCTSRDARGRYGEATWGWLHTRKSPHQEVALSHQIVYANLVAAGNQRETMALTIQRE